MESDVPLSSVCFYLLFFLLQLFSLLVLYLAVFEDSRRLSWSPRRDQALWAGGDGLGQAPTICTVTGLLASLTLFVQSIISMVKGNEPVVLCVLSTKGSQTGTGGGSGARQPYLTGPHQTSLMQRLEITGNGDVMFWVCESFLGEQVRHQAGKVNICEMDEMTRD